MLKIFTPSYEFPNHKRLFGLDLIRAISIIMVFLSHSIALNPLGKDFAFGLLGFGVEAFFVLSGFLIGRIILKTLLNQKISWKSVKVFWINRWLRTIPAYFFTLTIYYSLNAAPPNSGFYWFFTQNIITPIPGFFVHSWSLAVEEWFYLTFPVILLVLSFRKRISKYEIFIVGIIILIVFGFVTKLTYHIFYTNDIFAALLNKKLIFPSWNKFLQPQGDWENMRKIVPFRIDAIAYGCIIAFLVEKFSGLSSSVSIIMFFLGIVGLFLSYEILSATVVAGRINFFADVFLLPLFCISFALLIPYALILPSPGKIIVSIVNKISVTSYSFYLIHFLIIDFVIGKMYSLGELTVFSKWIVFVLTYTSTFLASYFMYRLIEIPFLNYRKRLTGNFYQREVVNEKVLNI
jgi:peptidoglycan/LPS O-acetylase OafA/YrhL